MAAVMDKRARQRENVLVTTEPIKTHAGACLNALMDLMAGTHGVILLLVGHTVPSATVGDRQPPVRETVVEWAEDVSVMNIAVNMETVVLTLMITAAVLTRSHWHLMILQAMAGRVRLGLSKNSTQALKYHSWLTL
jgi:hypothetical protein